MRLLVILLLLTLPAHADGAAAILSLLLVGGPIAPILALMWGYKQANRLPSEAAKWSAVALSAPTTATTCRFVFGPVFNEIAGDGRGIFCGPILLGVCFLAAVLPAFLLGLPPTNAARPSGFDGSLPFRYRALRVAVYSAVASLALGLLYLAFYVYPAEDQPEPQRVVGAWRDDEIDPSYKATLNRVALGMTYDEVVRLCGFPTAAWRYEDGGSCQRVMKDAEVERLCKEGLRALAPATYTLRFEPDFCSGHTEVKFARDGTAIAVYGESLEFSGRQIANEESSPPWLPPLKQVLPLPDDLRMTSNEDRTYYYRKLGLRINVWRGLSFSLHSERDPSDP